MWALLCVLPLALAAPEQVHLSLGTAAHSLHIQWLTYTRTASTEALLCAGAQCTVERGYAYHWKYSDKKSEPIDRFLHHVDLLDLHPGREYSYRVGSETEGIWSQNFTFLGPWQDIAEAPRSKDSASLLVLGDFGTCSDLSLPSLEALTAEAATMQDDAFIHTGDIAYNLEYFNGVRGDEFQRAIEAIASRVPYQVVVGNHEKHQNFGHFKRRFTMPGNAENLYYSLNIGPMHLVIYSSEVFCKKPNCRDVRVAQMNWLIQDLQKAQMERHVRPWVIAFAHKPLYCSTDWGLTDAIEDCHLQPLAMRREYEDLLAAHHVDLHFHGHVHTYERTVPLFQHREAPSDYQSPHLIVNPLAPVYVVEGSAGTCRPDDVSFPSPAPEPWSAFRSADLGYTRLIGTPSTLKLTRYRSLDRQPEDYLYIVKTQRNVSN